MMTVNEIIFGRRIDYRPEEEDALYTNMLREIIARPENLRERDTVKRVQNARIKNLGEKGAIELLGAVGIFLTQIPEKQMRNVEWEWMQRKRGQNEYM